MAVSSTQALNLFSFFLLAGACAQELSGDCLLGSGNASLSLLQAKPAAKRKGGHSLISSAAPAQVPPQSSRESKLHELFAKFNISQRLDGRSGERNPGRNKSLVVIVTHRELVIGCHGFEHFLSPDFHTWFVFEKHFASAWALDQKVKDPTSIGFPHLLTTDVVTGEVHARAAVLSLLQLEADEGTGPPELPEFMYSTMCDIQPLPTWHPYHTPFPDMVWEMVRVFSEEKALRAAGQGTTVQDEVEHRDGKFVLVNKSCFQADPHNRKQYPVLTVNNLIIETLPRADHVEEMHGRDVGHFVQQDGLARATPWRLPRLGAGELERPWLSDVTTFVEDHSILYDVALYLALMDDSSIAEQLQRTGDMLYHNEVYLVELACRYNLASIRHNNMFTFYDRAHPNEMSRTASGGARPVYNLSAYEDIDMDFVKTYNLELLAERDAPISRLTQFMSAAEHVKSTNDIDWGNSFAVMHFNRYWLPSQLFQPPPGSRGSVRELKSLLAPLFKIAGYEPRSVSDASEDVMSLQRTSVPMSRLLVIAKEGQLSPPKMLQADEEPEGVPKPAMCRHKACELFLDLWLPEVRERLAVWSSDGEISILGLSVPAPYSSPVLKGVVTGYDTSLEIPLRAELLYVGRPLARDAALTAQLEELSLAARRTCQLQMGIGEDDPNVFLPAAEQRFIQELAPFRLGNAQGIPPQRGFESCHLWT